MQFIFRFVPSLAIILALFFSIGSEGPLTLPLQAHLTVGYRFNQSLPSFCL